jgi:Peptidyl-tRNA hydrolase PTH2
MVVPVKSMSQRGVLGQMVLVVAANLGMSVGKVAAQCAHASLGLYKLMVSSDVPWLSSWEVRDSCTSRQGLSFKIQVLLKLFSRIFLGSSCRVKVKKRSS